MTSQQSGKGDTGSTRSPMPWQRQVPPTTQKGTSAPTLAPSFTSVSKGQAGPKHVVQPVQHRRGVGAASAHSRPAWHILPNIDRQPLAGDAANAQRNTGAGPKGRVFGVHGKVLPGAEQPDTRPVDLFDLHLVPHGNALHHRVQGVIPVLPAPGDVQGQVDFRVCFQFHRSLRPYGGRAVPPLLSPIRCSKNRTLKMEQAPPPDVDHMLGTHLVAAKTADALFIVDHSFSHPESGWCAGGSFRRTCRSPRTLPAGFSGWAWQAFGRRPQDFWQPVNKVRAGGPGLYKIRLSQRLYPLLHQPALRRGNGPQPPPASLLQHQDALRLQADQGGHAHI